MVSASDFTFSITIITTQLVLKNNPNHNADYIEISWMAIINKCAHWYLNAITCLSMNLLTHLSL